jgi:sugar lactone lactonase YvrE
MEEFARCGELELAGLAFDRDDNLFVCDPFNASIWKVDRGGHVTAFVDHASDTRLWWPNFAVFDADGTLWVSNSFDSPFTEIDFNDPHPHGSLMRFDPHGRGDLVATGMYLSNGLAIDPDEKYVYILQTRKNNCLRIPLEGGEPEIYSELGFPVDGMAFDAEGHLIVTLLSERRLVVVDPMRRITTLVEDPNAEKLVCPTNCAFGGPDFTDLYVAQSTVRIERPATDSFALLHLDRKGHPLINRR